MVSPTLVWFHNDLRLHDHPALFAGAQAGAVVPVYIWSPETEGKWSPGSASQWWLHHSLQALQEALHRQGIKLILRTGNPLLVLRSLLRETGATRVFWNERYEPALRTRDAHIAEQLAADGVSVETFAATLLHNPDTLQTSSGGPYRVFTPFWRKFLESVTIRPPLPAPSLEAPAHWPTSVPLSALGLLPTIDWANGLREAWEPGETGALARLHDTLVRVATTYDATRNRPDWDGTSRLSPHLHFGEISPSQVWHAVQEKGQSSGPSEAMQPYLRQLVWREFSFHLLYHFPHTPEAPLNEAFAQFPWIEDDEALAAWQKGQTGYPIVDAGMRQLWRMGWMHNRVRMIVASFLTKDLLLPWQAGAMWFWDTLVDADLANNTMGWQWTAGSGADAQPFFRIFNPVSQGERYDPDGAYIRRWLPALRQLPNRYIHKPWEAPAEVLAAAGVRLGDTYPHPMVDHGEARRAALAAYQSIRS